MNPHYSTGCGWRECPECGPLVELEIEAQHRRMVERTWPEPCLKSEWLADLYGTGPERGAQIISLEERRAARGTRAQYREIQRVKRVITNEQRAVVTAQWEAVKLRRSLRRDRDEVMSEAWLELLNPHRRIALLETLLPIEKKASKALERAKKTLKMRRADRKRYVSNDM